MQTGISLFKSKVAKRIFILFLICAMAPIGIFTCLSFIQVSANLKEQSMTRLQNTAKSYGLFLIERLSFLDTELDIFTSGMRFTADTNDGIETDNPYNDTMQRYFERVFVLTEMNSIIPLIGDTKTLPKDLSVPLAVINSTKTRFFFEPKNEKLTRIFLAKKISDMDGKPNFLVGEVNTTYMWGIGHENILPPLTESCILDHTRNVVYSSFDVPPQVLHKVRFESDSLESRSLAYSFDEEEYFLGYWPMFLKSRFEGPNLIVVLRNMQSDIFAPLSNFKLLFPLVALLAFWIVLLMSAISIRKSMVPLEKLKKGSLRLAKRDFETRVSITSGDEFEALADTFNKSAESLGRQFHAMEAMAEIDRAVHASLDTKKVVKTALRRMFTFYECDTICCGLMDARKTDTIRFFVYTNPESDNFSEEFLTLSAEDKITLSKQFEHMTVETGTKSPSFIPKQVLQTANHILILPLHQNGTLNGILCLGHLEAHPYMDDDLAHAQRLSNQVAAALSNAHLVEELEILNWGTLEALARTVDTKSEWTAGHSERVADLSVRIARVLGWDNKAIDNLHRAAYLHDIGKIGISLQILDKPGKLSEEEYEHVKKHPMIGAKIIEPIEAYADAIPIILQHHERFDGKGYPYGLSGENITLGGRILAVSDVYDALISSRPYRQGWVEEHVIQLIIDESGKQFDPSVVDAFLSAVSWNIDDILNETKSS